MSQDVSRKNHQSAERVMVIQRFLALILVFVLCVSLCSAWAEQTDAPQDGPSAGFSEDGEGSDEEGSSGLSEEDSSGESNGGSTGIGGLTNENFDADDLPEDYLKVCSHPGRVEKLRYITSDSMEDNKAVAVYLPVGYDDSEQIYNVMYILHASSGSVKNYLNPDSPTKLQRLLDHMIENGDLEPLIVVAATYYSPSDEMLQYMWLEEQVKRTKNFPREMVNDIIPAVEAVYRTYAWAIATDGVVTLEDIVATRDHRAIGGFSLGGVATWNMFLQQMQAFKWFLPISEASWDDGQGGTKGILDADTSAEVLYNAVKEQGYAKEDFMLFVATGGDDEAFDITTTQMVSLLEYADMFKPGENVSCSMMNNGTHTLSAVYTYLYHIMPALFWDQADD